MNRNDGVRRCSDGCEVDMRSLRSAASPIHESKRDLLAKTSDSEVGRFKRVALAVTLFALLFGGCRQDEGRTSTAEEMPDHDHVEAASAGSDRIDITPHVIKNLGITFVRVESRPVRRTVRLPGQFELRPEARREYHVMLPGRIELLVRQYESVKAGDELFVLDSPQWQEMQGEMVVALNAMRRSHADLAVAEAKLEEAREAIAFQEARLAKLAEAQVRQVELEAELAERRSMLPRLEAEVDAARTEFDAAHTQYEVLLDTAASLTGIERETLDPHDEDHGHMDNEAPHWRGIRRLTVRAEADGVVDRVAVTNRGWAETGGLILDTVDPSAVRFHADALQTDITLFADGQEAKIVPPQGGSIGLADTIAGTISVGFQAHPDQRTIPIFLEPTTLPSWAKPGVTAYLEVYLVGGDEAVAAVPESSVVHDGLDRVLFKRDADDPFVLHRVSAVVGESDGRWVEVERGVEVGDEVVLGGLYPLMLASSEDSGRAKGGHFHADGTFHAGHDDE